MTPAPAPRGAAAVPVGGLVVGVGAAALSLLGVLALALAAAAAAPSPDGSVDVDWSGATDVAVSLWLLGFGVPATAGAVTITWAPLGITLLVYALTAALARRHLAPVPLAALSAVLALAAAVALAASAVGSPDAWKGALVAAAVASAGCARGLTRGAGAVLRASPRLPAAVSAGVRAGGGCVLLLLAAGAATVLGWTVASAGEVGARAETLDPDPVGAVALAVGQSAYTPNLAVWGAAWLGGEPVSLGPYVPGLPLLGAVPAGQAGAWGFVAVAAVAGMSRWRARRWMPPGAAGWGATTLALGVVALCTAILIAVSGGSWAPGERVGPGVASGAWAVLLPTALGMAAAAALPVRGVSRSPRLRAATPAPRTGAPSTPPRMPRRTPPAP